MSIFTKKLVLSLVFIFFFIVHFDIAKAFSKGQYQVDTADVGGWAIVVDSNHTLWLWVPYLLAGDFSRPLGASILLREVDTAQFGEHRIVALKKDGSAWCYGLGSLGACNLRLEIESDGGMVKILDKCVAVSADMENTMLLRKDGTVWCWGKFIGSQKNPREEDKGPQKVKGLKDIIDVVTSGGYALALQKNGDLWAWGRTKRIEDNPSQSIREKPKLIMRGVKRVAGDYEVIFVLKKDGSVWGWGKENGGELQLQSLKESNGIPVSKPVHLFDDAIDIAVGGDFGMALKRDGTVWTWGSSAHGTLGRGPDVRRADGSAEAPLLPLNLPKIVSISAQRLTAFATAEDGTLWTWGLAPLHEETVHWVPVPFVWPLKNPSPNAAQ